MANHMMMTGFPGFISQRLYRALAADDATTRFTFLIHPSQMEKASRLTSSDPRVTLLVGDITKLDLGVSSEDIKALSETVTHFFHLAAIYDLAVPKDLAYQVNVIGTENVNQFLKSLSSLDRYIYFSTAYVSGDRTGRVLENELDEGQGFKNYYEETKFEAEKRVVALEGVPTTIIRPGVVVGDSASGETIKFDGPYFMLRFLDKLPLGPVPYLGKGNEVLNIVPVDFIIRATVYLAKSEQAVGKALHLTDSSPYPAREIYRMFCRELLAKKPTYNFPKSIAQILLKFSTVRRYLELGPETIAYIYHPSVYDSTEATRILSEGGIHCPDLVDYVPNMVRFFREHRGDSTMKVALQ
ncbi:Male sterility protein [Marininema mesophilum]|uniref:Male sterility protein n=1 Tax=Marininema mesophilum TaxID=1048340 RepID=A0A1H2YE96_9BACL|nr:SDR family oxidoreductase [Marininema mesophilum]SDX03380.1 Male sterility protein [Marininema mesophilum]